MKTLIDYQTKLIQTKTHFNSALNQTEGDSLLCGGITAHTHTMETHSMEKVPSMENFSINQTE